MRSIFLPKHEKIYALFNDSAQELIKAAHEFNLLLNHLPNAHHHSQLIATFEKEADKIANATFQYLHRSFITPFDHYDIQQVIIKLDDILDALNRTSQRIALYQLHQLPMEIVSLGSLCIRLSELVAQNVNLITSLKNTTKIFSVCEEITKFKSEAQKRLTSGIGELFQMEIEIKHLIKIKDIYESAKFLVDKYEDFANVIKSIILEYS